MLHMLSMQFHMVSNCFLFTLILQEQRNGGKYPYPWSSLDSGFLKSLWKRQRANKFLWKHNESNYLNKNSSTSGYSSTGAASALSVAASSVKEKAIMLQQSDSSTNQQNVHMSWKENVDGALA